MSSTHATLSAASDDRKARLARLRSIKRKQPDDEIVPPESDRASPAVHGDSENTAAAAAAATAVPDVARLHLSGRNYDPETRGAKLGFEAPPNLAAGDDTLEAKAAELEAEVREQEEEEAQNDVAAGGGAGIDLFKLQPKKPNWDLKRELNKRLETLNTRTDNAIARLVRERLAAKQPQPEKAADKPDTDDEGALEGAALVEGVRLREAEEAEEARREREAEE